MHGAPHHRTTDRPEAAEARATGAGDQRLEKRSHWRSRRRWQLVTSGAVLLLAVVALLAIGPVVRSRVVKEGLRRRLDVSIGAVRPGFFAIGLKDVDVRLHGVEGVRIRIDQVRISFSATLSVSEIAAHGGEIHLDGEPEDLVERLKAFQIGQTSEVAVSENAQRTPISADGLALIWKLSSDGEIRATAIRAARSNDAIELTVGRLTASQSHNSLEIIDGDVELSPHGVARRLSATSVTLGQGGIRPARAPAPAPTIATTESIPPPLPQPPSAKRHDKPPRKTVNAAALATVDTASSEAALPLPDLHVLRARIAVLGTTIGSRVPDGVKVDITGLTVKLDAGDEPITVGPGPFTMERHGNTVHLTFASEKSSVATPLAIDAELPLAEGDVTARLSGGPVSLALLGVNEGMKGFFDVAKGTVSGKGQLVLAAAGDAVTFDGQIALKSISLKHPRLSAEPLRGIDFSVSARGLLDDAGKLRVDDAQLDMGALHIRTHGTLEESRDHFGLSLAVEVAPAACQALLESTPQGLLPTVRSARMMGTLAATSRVVFDTRAIDKLVLEYQVDDHCQMAEVPRDLSRDRFTSSFTYRTYHPDGKPGDTTTGPGTAAWTDLDNISPYMVIAVLTTEDGAFYRHHGFNHSAIRNSVAANLKARRFVRGASTITMQLAKNLFLSREKTLSRKIEEVVLADYLEQAFRKDDMMELYLNVIEFGPDVYGVTRAAEHYFGRKPEELTLPESFFLASVMPSPVRYGRLREKGPVSEGWMRHIQTLMEIAAKNGKISRAELSEGLAQSVVFIKADDPRPQPRKPVSAGRRDPMDEDSGWQPLD